MRLQIFVEDELAEAYEHLALRVLGPPAPGNRSIVRASRVDLEAMRSFEGLLRLTLRVRKGGFNNILFVMDQEGPDTQERPAKLMDFQLAFQKLCDHLARQKPGQPLYQVKAARIVCQRCLEGWLAADLQAAVDAVRGRHGVDYHPASQRTDNVFPHQASEKIAQVIRETGRRLGRQDLQKVSTRVAKSLGSSIAEHVDPNRARSYNRSLDYFYTIIQGDRNGCDHPFPDGPIEP